MNPLHWFFILCLLLFTACDNSEKPKLASGKRYQKGEYLYRVQNEHIFQIPQQEKITAEPYFWEKGQTDHSPKITKEFFRCKGSSLNPVRIVQEKGELVRYFDCGGAEKHSLPQRDNKEFIYPILIDLINYIQFKTEKRVVITSGHRCPEHNTYVDHTPSNQSSKHLIGAEVSFYVQGMEDQTDKIIKYIQEYYAVTAKYQGQKDYLEFQRYEKNDINILTKPWHNKEIFVKFFKGKEGRNFDNRHPYPYFSIQVRYDWDLQQRVIYTWDQAYHNYLRH